LFLPIFRPFSLLGGKTHEVIADAMHAARTYAFPNPNLYRYQVYQYSRLLPVDAGSYVIDKYWYCNSLNIKETRICCLALRKFGGGGRTFDRPLSQTQQFSPDAWPIIIAELMSPEYTTNLNLPVFRDHDVPVEYNNIE
jgi:hypothetical protein